MTIKEFSQICRCSTQTLRYYDRIGLLKPTKIDPWSGYRYYDAEQAVDFVKIKNLQAADFSISEIKTLMNQSDDLICAAFDRKIEAQQQKIEQIRAIRQTYLREKTDMVQIINSISDFLVSQLSDFSGLTEFGLTEADGPRIVALVRSYLAKWTLRDSVTAENMTLVVNDEVIHGVDQVADRIRSFSESNLEDKILLGDETVAEEADFDPAQYETFWECHCWEHVHQFIDEIPAPELCWEYCCWFRLNAQSYRNDISFPMYMLGALLLKTDLTGISMSCAVDRSDNGENHFALLRRKQ